jgi:hypothetical protein
MQKGRKRGSNWGLPLLPVWKEDFKNILSSLYYIKSQKDATLAVLFISNCKIPVHVSDASRVHHQEY